MEVSRRNFIRTLGLAGGSILLFPACNTNITLWHFFTEEEAKLVIAIAEQIIPADQDPGATDAGVVYFIDKQLAGFYSDQQQNYRKGLIALQQYCKAQFNKIFEELDWDHQAEVLVKMEIGELNSEGDSLLSTFFKLIKDHSMQGFYGSPRHGGNKNFVSYKMLKLDYPHVIGQNRYSSRCETLNIYGK